MPWCSRLHALRDSAAYAQERLQRFPIGAAIKQRQFTGEDKRGVPIILSQFNCIAPENVLKRESVNPRPDTNGYDFAAKYVEFGGCAITFLQSSTATRVALKVGISERSGINLHDPKVGRSDR